MGAGVGKETNNLVPPTSGSVSKIIHNAVAGGFYRGDYQFFFGGFRKYNFEITY